MLVKDSVESVTEYLEKSLNTKTVIGEPYKINDKITLVPVVDVTFGYGAGSGEGKATANTGLGGGGGAGAKLAAKAIIVVKGDEVSVLPLAKDTALEKMVEAVPTIIDKVPSIVEKLNLRTKEERKEP